MIKYSILAAVIPMTFYLILIYRLDKNEREPVLFIILHFLWGAVVSVGLVFFAEIILSIMPIGQFGQSLNNSKLFGLLIKAPFFEELSKISLIFLTVKSKEIDNLTDGLVYGAAIGLGFGMTENALYFINNSEDLLNWIYLVFIRSSFSGVMHGISTSIFAAFIILAKFNKLSWRKVYYLLGFAIALLIHFTWNFSVIYEQTFFYGIISILIGIAAFLIIMKSSLKYEIKILTEQLSEENFESENISSFYKKKKTFINLPLQQFRLYIKLGFAKKKLANATKKESVMLEKYINDLRNKLAVQQL